ncbi:MAG TPA: UvrB/UvrC motif-containing protein [Clostridiales bacterium]|jgi:protein arginine kinase activator|nr:UvrB/UvrC motif-containing protein [Clostridiales bacterium]
MLCQNCERQEATTHITKVVNGETTATHLCSQCAANLGYGDFLSGFSLNLGGLFDSIGNEKRKSGQIAQTRCPKCGSSFEDIAKSGKIGCAECYNTFYEKLLPTLQRIHGRIRHSGKVSEAACEENKKQSELEKLRCRLNAAVEEQNYEEAAVLRDKIRELEKEA